MTHENHPIAYEDCAATHIYSSKETRKYGMLKKKSGGRKVPIFQKKYESRFIIIHKGWVYYYLSKTSEKPQGKFSLEGFSNRVIQAEEEQAQIQYVFKLYHKRKSERTWYFAAENISEMQDWMDAFRSEIDRYTFGSTDLRASRSMPVNPVTQSSLSFAKTDNGPRSRSVSTRPSDSIGIAPSARSSVTDVTSGFVSDADPSDDYEEVAGSGMDSSQDWEPSSSYKNKPLPPTPGRPMSPKPLSPFNKSPLPLVPEDDLPPNPPPRPPTSSLSPKATHQPMLLPTNRPPWRDGASKPGPKPIRQQSSPLLARGDEFYEKYYDNPGMQEQYDDNLNDVYDVPDEEDASYESPTSDHEDVVEDVMYDDHDVDEQMKNVRQLGKPPMLPSSPKPIKSPGKICPPTPPLSNKPNLGKSNFARPVNQQRLEPSPNHSKADSGANATAPGWKGNLKSSLYPDLHSPTQLSGQKPPTPTNPKPPTPTNPKPSAPSVALNPKPSAPSVALKPKLRSPASSTEEQVENAEKPKFGAHMLRKTGAENSGAPPSWQKKPPNPTARNENPASSDSPAQKPPWVKKQEPDRLGNAPGSSPGQNEKPSWLKNNSKDENAPVAGGVKSRWGAQTHTTDPSSTSNPPAQEQKPPWARNLRSATNTDAPSGGAPKHLWEGRSTSVGDGTTAPPPVGGKPTVQFGKPSLPTAAKPKPATALKPPAVAQKPFLPNKPHNSGPPPPRAPKPNSSNVASSYGYR